MYVENYFSPTLWFTLDYAEFTAHQVTELGVIDSLLLRD